MKGLRKFLTPFAPDQSGAVSVCYALGGMVVIVDAGGCAGNICGFDEPRWQPDYDVTQKAQGRSRVEAVFSAGLRDMDAILGRDDLLVRKLEDAAKKIDAGFIALIGTPVPAVIGTDLPAIASMTQRKISVPCIAVSTDGMHLYDKGMGDALSVLMKTFAGKREDREDTGSLQNDIEGCSKEECEALEADERKEDCGKRPSADTGTCCGVLGLSPLDFFKPSWVRALSDSLHEQGYERVLLYGMEGGLDAVRDADRAKVNYVVSPSGIEAAKYLEKEFQIPYRIGFPADAAILMEGEHACETALDPSAGKILIVHQAVLASAIRDKLRQLGSKAKISTATWFETSDELMEQGDVRLKEEDDFTSLVIEGDYDVIIADPYLRALCPDYRGKWIDALHFAVSGQMAIDMRERPKEV